MTIYICQIPHRMPPKVWGAETAAQVIDLCNNDETSFADLYSAVIYDMAEAHVAESPFALFSELLSRERVHQRNEALSAVAAAYRSEAEQLADYDADADVYRAFDGRAVYDENDGVLTIGNTSVPISTLAYAMMMAHDNLNARFDHVDV